MLTASFTVRENLPLTKWYLEHDTELYPLVGLQFWSFEDSKSLVSLMAY